MNDYGKIGFAVALGSIAYSIYLRAKLCKIAASIDLTVDELENKTSIDISDSVIEAAVQKAVNREIQEVVRVANRRLAEEIRSQVKESVNTSYSELKSSVSNELSKQVKNINIQSIEKEVISKAKEAIAEKFDGKLDTLLEGFNDNLNNVSKIYASIAKTMSEK